MFYCSVYIFWYSFTCEIALSQSVVGILVSLSRGLPIPLHRLGDPSLPLEELSQRVLGVVIPDLGGGGQVSNSILVVDICSCCHLVLELV